MQNCIIWLKFRCKNMKHICPGAPHPSTRSKFGSDAQARGPAKEMHIEQRWKEKYPATKDEINSLDEINS